MHCELLEKCPFHEQVRSLKMHSSLLDEYVKQYCHGRLQKYCYRKQHYERTGKMLDPRISPAGLAFNSP